MTRVERLLQELTEAHGPSGFEDPVRAIMRRELAPLSTCMESDGMGSLIAPLKGAAGSPRIMLTAHMDEVGMLVKYVTPEGFIRFQPLGGWLDEALINQRYAIATRKGVVLGVTGIKTVHVMTAEERANPEFRWQHMFIDVGAASQRDAEERLGIRPGDPIAPHSPFMPLAGGELYLGKAWDDRAGLAVMIEVMRRLVEDPPPGALHAVATVQEEVGLRGALTSVNQVRPEVGINLEAGVASDYPGITQEEAQEKMGQGPSLHLHDSSMLPNLRLRDLVIDVAAEQGIPLQFNVLTGYGHDGAAIQKAAAGAPCINIAIPTRYLHSHNSVLSRKDFDRTVDLVTALVRRLDAETLSHLKSFD